MESFHVKGDKISWIYISNGKDYRKPKCTTCFSPFSKKNDVNICKCGAYLCKACVGSKCV